MQEKNGIIRNDFCIHDLLASHLKYQIFKWVYVRKLKEPPDLALLDDRLIPRMCCSELYKK